MGTAVASLGFANAGGLAFDPNRDTLYSIDSLAGELYEIDPASGNQNLIGMVRAGLPLRGLSFDPRTDTLYGVDWNSRALYTLDITNAGATAVGPPGSLRFTEPKSLAFGY